MDYQFYSILSRVLVLAAAVSLIVATVALVSISISMRKIANRTIKKG